MHRATLAFFALALTIASTAANAQITTLTYLGSVMTGEASSLINNTLPTVDTPWTGTITASLITSGSIAANDLALLSYEFNINGSDGINIGVLQNEWGPPFPLPPFFSTDWIFGSPPASGTAEITRSNGAITGMVINVYVDAYHVVFLVFDIGPSGDDFTYELGYACTPYQVIVNPCYVSAGNGTPGLWTTAAPPEGSADWLKALQDKVIGVGPGKSLANTLVIAEAYYAAHDVVATCATLVGFTDEVRAQSGKKINSGLAATLIANANSIEGLIGCQ